MQSPPFPRYLVPPRWYIHTTALCYCPNTRGWHTLRWRCIFPHQKIKIICFTSYSGTFWLRVRWSLFDGSKNEVSVLGHISRNSSSALCTFGTQVSQCTIIRGTGRGDVKSGFPFVFLFPPPMPVSSYPNSMKCSSFPYCIVGIIYLQCERVSNVASAFSRIAHRLYNLCE